jgi:hypothetical protein
LIGPPEAVVSVAAAHGVGRSTKNMSTPATQTDSSTTVTVVLGADVTDFEFFDEAKVFE